MNNDVVVTGLGILVPGCDDKQALWVKALTPQACGQFNEDLQGHVAVIDEQQLFSGLSKRQIRKIDSFSHFGLVAAERALQDAGLNPETVDRQRIGVLVGNCFGGWAFTERELRNLHKPQGSSRDVSPFQATAWFPAAVQGQISLQYGLKGFSKTLMADRASSLMSVGMAANLIAQGKLDCAIAGGCEAINTDFILAALQGVPEGITPTGHYAPFDKQANGMVPGEGAVFLLLESVEHAQARGKEPYAQIKRWSMRNDPTCSGKGLEQTMLAAAGGCPVDLLIADGAAQALQDQQEAEVIQWVLSQHTRVSTPKASIGQLFGAAGALDIALAALMLEKQVVLPTPQCSAEPIFTNQQLIQQAEEKALSRILINSRGLGGTAATLALSAFH
ncbi:beta-ketoacyl-[acyl-carrier-protein] synthase family protein [Zooshikella harenae]|uniref:Ketosynthase family 3 (KS3) domain-containing protein n=1 Tax=Zooshikella harenae TaxID=2827238 RepID=A0ABS5ZHA0_9GAMM|nr:beta-ketoacyl synthase N-terminal-like domain-containing protein [Zooshikella harenae]MBU2713434.1 hypothetical protein [Zooshikella harenae]